jgi:hypothetical protein
MGVHLVDGVTSCANIGESGIFDEVGCVSLIDRDDLWLETHTGRLNTAIHQLRPSEEEMVYNCTVFTISFH